MALSTPTAPASGSNSNSSRRYRYATEIQQMMFVFGEVADALPETTALVEDIVRSQVIEITTQAAAQAQKRGARGISQEDLLFIIRHDRSKVNRLSTFLSWKDVRRNAKDSQGGTAVPGASEPAEDLVEEAEVERPSKGRKRIKLPWELVNTYTDVLNEDDDEEEDEDELEAYRDSMQRLKDADEITRKMTREEYVHYSECRQASFTYRKAKRFREWANMSAYTDVKPNDDLIDILGFLSFEMVRTITEAALMVKRAEEMSSANKSGAGKRKRSGSISRDGDQSGEVDHTLDDGKADGHGAGNGESGGDGEGRTGDDNAGSNNGNGNSSSNTGDNSDDNNDEVGLFAPPATGRTPIRAEHVMEGYRRLQHVPRPSWLFRGGLARSRVSII